MDAWTELQPRIIIRKLEHQLRQESIVDNIELTNECVLVKYKTGVSERWWRFDNTKKLYIGESLDGQKVGILSEFPNRIEHDEELVKLPLLRYQDWVRGNFYEKRISIQKILQVFLNLGWVKVRYPTNKLMADFKKIRDHNHKRNHLFNGVLHIYGNRLHGRVIANQFLPWAEAVKPYWRPYLLFNAIKRCLSRRHDVTRATVIDYLSNFRNGFINPGLYRLILEHFGLTGLTVVDPCPDLGMKAVGTILAGCEYSGDIDLCDLSKFLGCSIGKLDRDYYDVVWLDGHWRTEKVVFDKWFQKADYKIVYVPREQRKVLPKPERFIPVRTRPGSEVVDFIFLYV